MRTLIILTVFIITPAIAGEAVECAKAAEAYGAIFRASLFCNFQKQAAIERSATVMRESCASPRAARPGVEAGSKIFEGDRRKSGDRKACADWAEFIQLLSR